MSYPKHFLGVFGGFLGNAASVAFDEWQCTIRLARTGAGTASAPDPAVVLTNEFKTAVETFVRDVSGPFSSYSKVSYLKLNEINALGRYANATNTNLYEYAAGSEPQGAGAPGCYDPAQALVLSWLTAFKRGPGHAGRMFVPMPRGALQGDGRFTQSFIDGTVNSAKTFIQNLAVGGLATAQWGACVVTNKGTGAANEIQGVRVGNVMDHQLRRRDKMIEEYTEARF